jgi:excisionase family DNA binding protein
MLNIASPKVVSFDALLSVAEVADVLSKKKSWVYEALKADALRAVRVGGSTRVQASELKRFIEALPAAEFRPNRTATHCVV